MSTFIIISSGIISALLSFALTVGMWELLLLSYFIPFPLLFIGLFQGFQACLVAVGAAVLTLLLLTDVLSVSIFVLLYALPSVILVYHVLLYKETEQKKVWASEGYVFGILAGLALLGLGCGWLFTLQTGFQVSVATLFDELKSSFPDNESIQTVEVSFITGLLLVSWMLQYILNGVLVQIALVRMEKGLRPRLRLSNLTLPRWVIVVFVGSVVLGSLFGGEVGFLAKNVVFISGVGLFFTGLSVFHSTVESYSYRVLLLVLFYFFLFSSLWVVGLMVILGLAEHWLRLRRYFTQAST